MVQTALILGATGRFGTNAAAAFETAGWDVRRFDRSHDDLASASRGVDVIVNAWNPAYPDWAKQLPGIHANVIEAAQNAGATVILPGNVYVFGAATPAPWSENAPHRAANPLGRLRIQMETAYREAGVRTIVLRAGDFIDTRASGNWFDMIMTKSLRKGIFTYPGDPTIPHAWAFLPDLCRAAVDLAEKRGDLPVFTDVPFPGYTLTGAEITATLSTITRQTVRLKSMSWLPVYLARPFWPMAKHLLEMRYLWNTPHWLDAKKLNDLLPDFAPTPPELAFKQAVQHLSVSAEIHPNQTVTAGR